MPIYEYKAFGSGGATKTGVVDADTPRAARQKLRRDNILVSSLSERKGKHVKKGAKLEKTSVLKRISKARAQNANGPKGRDLDTVTAITRQLGTLLGAGIPLAETLRAIIDQAESRKIETMFREIRERITQGSSMGDALSDHPDMFSELYINMVRAGEATGNVDQVLVRLSEFMHSQRALQRKVVSALLYPLMMVVIGIIVVGILMTFVVPKISSMLEDTGQELPTPTVILITISDVFKNYWWVMALGIAAVSFIIERIYKTNKGRLSIDKFLLNVPVLGELFRKQSVARFTRTFSTLLGSGVPAVRSLEITSNVIGNRVLADATGQIRERILEGTDIATPLKSSGVFPPMVGYMVAVGEQSGQLEEMLDRIADSYDEEIEVVTERVTALLEPIMIVALASVVGFIVYSIILPILQVSNIA